jgi:hypothetical protein
VSLTPVAFAASVVDTGGQCPLVSLTPVSTTLAKLVAKFAIGVVDTGGKFAIGVVDAGSNFSVGVVYTCDTVPLMTT